MHSPSQVTGANLPGAKSIKHSMRLHSTCRICTTLSAVLLLPAAQYSTEATPLPAAHEQEENSTYTYTAHVYVHRLQYV